MTNEKLKKGDVLRVKEPPETCPEICRKICMGSKVKWNGTAFFFLDGKFKNLGCKKLKKEHTESICKLNRCKKNEEKAEAMKFKIGEKVFITEHFPQNTPLFKGEIVKINRIVNSSNYIVIDRYGTKWTLNDIYLHKICKLNRGR